MEIYYVYIYTWNNNNTSTVVVIVILFEWEATVLLKQCSSSLVISFPLLLLSLWLVSRKKMMMRERRGWILFCFLLNVMMTMTTQREVCLFLFVSLWNSFNHFLRSFFTFPYKHAIHLFSLFIPVFSVREKKSSLGSGTITYVYHKHNNSISSACLSHTDYQGITLL